jgi:ubiquinone/menaquinone biosynthesis C-methylase UbiE
MKKVKSPYFTFPRMTLSSRPVEQSEALARKLGGRQVLAIELHHLLQSCFRPRARITVLDLVCGTGGFSRFTAELCRNRGYAASLRAIDFDQKAVERARSLSDGDPGIRFEVVPMAEWAKLPASSVDLVTCCFGLHGLPLDHAVSLVEAIDRVARTAWLVLDMKRTRMLTMVTEAMIHWTPGNGRLGRDAGSLTQQAFTGHELKNLAFHAGVSDYSWRTWLLHQVMIRHKQ